MNDGIVIIGSGFAARQLVKSIRRLDPHVPLTLIASDSIDEYNKPDLRHVISRGQQAGARAVVPPVSGHPLMLTLNSQQEYQAARQQLTYARRVLIVGGGLISCELALDFWRAGKSVSVLDNNASLLASLMPPEVGSRLQHQLIRSGVGLLLNRKLDALTVCDSGIRAGLADRHELTINAVVVAAGLRPEMALARSAGVEIGRGIKVNHKLQTSNAHIFALGDCAEIEGVLLPFLQPMVLSVTVLAKTLLDMPAELKLPPMLVKIKTPDLPMQLAGNSQRADLCWHIASSAEGIIARGVDYSGELQAFVVSEGQMKEAFALLKALS